MTDVSAIDPFDAWLADLPKGWSLKKVGREFANIGSGTTPPTDNQKWYGEGYPWVTTGELRENLITSTEKSVTADAACEFTTLRRYQPGTLLVAMYGATIGRLGLLGCEATTNQACCALSEPLNLEPKYVFYWLQAFREQLIRKASGGGQPNVNQDVIRELRISSPSRVSQQRIANFLDDKTSRIDALIAEKERLVKSLEEFQYSNSSRLMTCGMENSVPTIRSSYPEIGVVPAHWKVTPLKFLGEVRSGVAKGKDNGNKDTVSLPYLRVANVQAGYVDLTEVSTIDVSTSDAGRYLLQKGDVLMNEGGDNDKLGRGAVWEGQVDPCIHQNHVFAVRLNKVEHSDWVSAFTSTDAARTYFYLRSKQSTNLASINQSNVRELPVPMPPDEERKAIMSELKRSSSAINDLIEHAVQHITRLREYRSSLISVAVTGQLDVGSLQEVS